MSHPNPQYEPSNSYPSDNYKPAAKMSVSSFKKEMKGIRGSLQKAVGHGRRERHVRAQIAAKMKSK